MVRVTHVSRTVVRVTLDDSILTTLTKKSEEEDISNPNLPKTKECLTDSALRAHYVNPNSEEGVDPTLLKWSPIYMKTKRREVVM